MHVKAVLVRFFRSFNFDFLRKNHPNATPQPWEMIGPAWFPFVRIPLCADVTTVAGANESGKSHLLTAVEKGLTGKGVTRRDFCRYSKFFTVEKGEMRTPDFGFQFAGLTPTDRDLLASQANIGESVNFEEFVLIRTGCKTLSLWVNDVNGGDYKRWLVRRIRGSFLG